MSAGRSKRPAREQKRAWMRRQERAEKGRTEHWHILERRQFWLELHRRVIKPVGPAHLRSEAGVDPTELNRLRNEKSATISDKLLKKLLGAIPEAERKPVYAALLRWIARPDEYAALVRANYWCAMEVGATPDFEPPIPIFRRGKLRFLDVTNAHPRREWEDHRAKEFIALKKRVGDLLPEHSLSLPSGLEYSPVVWSRILGPLLQWEISGFTERSWKELTDAELRRFVVAGLERETVLCNRNDNLTRVRIALESQAPPPALDNEESRRKCVRDDNAEISRAEADYEATLAALVEAALSDDAERAKALEADSGQKVEPMVEDALPSIKLRGPKR